MIIEGINLLLVAAGLFAISILLLVSLNRRAVQNRRELGELASALGPQPTYESWIGDPISEWPPAVEEEGGVAHAEVTEPSRALAESETAAVRNPPPSSIPGNPVEGLVSGLVEGDGPLDDTAMRRLELYRPDKVVQVVDSMFDEVSGRKSEAKRRRLTQIRQYAESLQISVTKLQEMKTSSPQPEEQEAVIDEWQDSEAVTETEQSAELRLDEELSIPVQETESLPETVEEDEKPSRPVISIETPAETEKHLQGRRVQPDEAAADMAGFRGIAGVPGIADAPEIADTQYIEEDVLEVEHVPEVVELWEVEAEAEATTAIEAESVEELPRIDFLGPEVRRAEDLFSLQAREQKDALCLLETLEVGRVIELSDDQELKLAAIDVLGDTATKEALQALQASFDDSDPVVQLRAVDTAETVLEEHDF